jgi:hypothetical protein
LRVGRDVVVRVENAEEESDLSSISIDVLDTMTVGRKGRRRRRVEKGGHLETTRPEGHEKS